MAAHFAVATSGLAAKPAKPTHSPSAPPRARVEVVVDSAFGLRVEDPYRWMEKPDNPEFLAWIRAQGEYARDQLDAIPGRAAIAARLTELSHGAQ
ncbi:MAG TPA: hypothetical protein VFU59_06210, partial [Candidatus Eisenbacteria bacterium]|nr:hypothetical protein [Candidatus Eisenbacteria bacterium]